MLIRAVAALRERDPALADQVTVVICGGPSGSGLDRPTALIELAATLGVADRVRFLPPRTGDDLPALYRAADLVAVPSHNESFGLVALEAQACGTPVLAAAVGGLVTAVRDQVSGVLVDGHDPVDWARALGRLLPDRARRAVLGRGAEQHARQLLLGPHGLRPARRLRRGDRRAPRPARRRPGRRPGAVLLLVTAGTGRHRCAGRAGRRVGPVSPKSDLAALIESVCAERDLAWESTGPGSYAVTLPGTHKLKTICNLIVGEHALRIEAFVMRQPDERREELWAWLLQRNARMYGVSFSTDAVGDVYLTGRVNPAGVDADELDRLLGAVLTYADESFDTMLEIGFGSSIRRE